jgi:ABC-type nitrate/sulfonate/bicarbonate transport system substrate-binding protein
MTVLAEPILTLAVADQYEVAEPIEVRAFVAARSHLASFLAEAPEKIAQFFADAPLKLEHQIDPDDNSELLILRVCTDLDVAAALGQMDSLLDAWYLDLPLDVRRDAVVTLGA